MRETVERELKLTPGPRFRLAELSGEPLEPRVFTSTYVDTDDLRLARAGVTLRRRVERSRGLWQLKLSHGVSRLELEAPGGPTAPPRELEELLFAIVRGRPLAPIAKLRTRRSGLLVADDGVPVAEATLDAVSALQNGRVRTSFREIEVELVGEGDEKALRRIEKALRRAGAEERDWRPKVFRALDLEWGGPPKAPDATAPTSEHLRSMLAAQYAQILAHDPGTRLARDAEELHQLRVATRRLRAFLRATRDLLDPDWAEGLRLELSWLGAALGPVRDLDVLIEHLTDDVAALDPSEQRSLARLFAVLEEERDDARARLDQALRSDRYLRLLDRLEDAAATPRVVSDHLTLPEIAADEFRRLRRAVRALPADPEDEELHATRIKGKRARYAAELAEPVVGKRATRFIAAAKEFQDVVGEHQDAVVAEDRIRNLLRRLGGARTGFAGGRLVERQRARRAAARAAFPAAWRALEKAGKAAWRT